LGKTINVGRLDQGVAITTEGREQIVHHDEKDVRARVGGEKRLK
jgi:hypothetical protein